MPPPTGVVSGPLMATRKEAFQISRPVPSPSMNGTIGCSGTRYLPLLYSIFCPLDGTGTPLNDAMIFASRSGEGTFYYKEYREFASGAPGVPARLAPAIAPGTGEDARRSIE